MATATVKLLEGFLTTRVVSLEKSLEELKEANKISVSELKDELARERSIWEEKEKKMAARLDKAEKMLMQQQDETKKLWQAIYEASRRSTVQSTTGADGAIVGVSVEATEVKLSNNSGPLTGLGTLRLSCMKSLKKLDICGIRDESAFTYLYTMTWLEELTLRTGTFSSTMAQGVGNWTVLTRLDLIDCKISDAGLAQLIGLSSLQILVLSRTQNHHRYIDSSSIPSSAGMVHVAKLRRLISLDISASVVRDDGLQHLSSLEKLIWLSLPSQVSARGLQHLKCLSLETILFRSSIDHYGVEHPKAIPSLKKVGLSDSYDVNIVKRALPDINVFQL